MADLRLHKPPEQPHRHQSKLRSQKLIAKCGLTDCKHYVKHIKSVAQHSDHKLYVANQGASQGNASSHCPVQATSLPPPRLGLRASAIPQRSAATGPAASPSWMRLPRVAATLGPPVSSCLCSVPTSASCHNSYQICRWRCGRGSTRRSTLL